MDDAGAGRYYGEVIEGVLTPFEELVSLVVACKFELHISVE